MRNLYLFTILICLTGFSAQAQSLSTNTAVRSCLFLHPTEGAFAEVYLVAGANALRPAAGNNGFTAGVDVSILVIDAAKGNSEGSNVLNYDKFRLNTPVFKDTNLVDFSIIDQKRLAIPNKTVTVEVTVTDINDPSNYFVSTEVLTSYQENMIQISDIQFAESYKPVDQENNFSKNGVELMPYPLTFFPSTKSSIILYGEVYGADKYLQDDQFLVAFSIKNASTNEFNPTFYQYVKAEKQPVFSFLREINIADLPSGNYNLYVEVRNKKNELITQKVVYIQRANTGPVYAWENIKMINTAGTFTEEYSEEQLDYFLGVIRPRATESDLNLIESLSGRVEPDMKRKFLYNFWVERNAADPYGEWKKYLALVKEANNSFGTPSRQGYKTERGRVYLQYGPPYDVVTSVNEAGAYPYEIWFYTTLPDKQTNIGFAFYEPTMVSNDYILLHSNARGELHEPRWKVKLYENVASPQEVLNFDNTEVEDKIGGHRAVDMYQF